MKKWINGFVCLLSIGFLTLPCLGQSKPAVEEDCPTCDKSFDKYVTIILKEGANGWEVHFFKVHDYSFVPSRGKTTLTDGYKFRMMNANNRIVSQISVAKPQKPIVEWFSKSGKIESYPISSPEVIMIKIPWRDDLTDFEMIDLKENQNQKQVPIMKGKTANMIIEASQHDKE